VIYYINNFWASWRRVEQTTRTHIYQAFILRCWAESSLAEKPVWRFSLEPVAGGKRIGFSDLKTLVSFLERQTGAEGGE
jgi:hypothetical protein